MCDPREKNKAKQNKALCPDLQCDRKIKGFLSPSCLITAQWHKLCWQRCIHVVFWSLHHIRQIKVVKTAWETSEDGGGWVRCRQNEKRKTKSIPVKWGVEEAFDGYGGGASLAWWGNWVSGVQLLGPGPGWDERPEQIAAEAEREGEEIRRKDEPGQNCLSASLLLVFCFPTKKQFSW